MDRREAISKALEGIGLVPTELVVDLFERALEQAGWVIVPREPSEAMIESGEREYFRHPRHYGEHTLVAMAVVSGIFRAMISKEGA